MCNLARTSDRTGLRFLNPLDAHYLPGIWPNIPHMCKGRSNRCPERTKLHEFESVASSWKTKVAMYTKKKKEDGSEANAQSCKNKRDHRDAFLKPYWLHTTCQELGQTSHRCAKGVLRDVQRGKKYMNTILWPRYAKQLTNVHKN